jgi:signal transduction histidine kinase
VIRRLFVEGNGDKAPDTQGEILEATRINKQGRLEYFYFHHHIDKDFGDLFLLSRHDADDIETVSWRLFLTTLEQAFWITFVLFCVLFLLIRWLIRRTSEPLILLSEWAENLGKNPYHPLKTDFPIQELNQLAAQLRDGVDKLETFNRREQEFLRYASHELRAPLGVIQASLDTLHLQQGSGENTSLIRALKASDNVRELISALLWLARDSSRAIDKSKVDLPKIIEQVITQHRPLITGRHGREVKIDVAINCDEKTLSIEEGPFRIVLSNLIRNAFQHNSGGDIIISASGQNLEVINETNSNMKPVDNAPESNIDDTPIYSFGLGLQLVQRICQKCGWQFQFSECDDQVRVSIQF